MKLVDIRTKEGSVAVFQYVNRNGATVYDVDESIKDVVGFETHTYKSLESAMKRVKKCQARMLAMYMESCK